MTDPRGRASATSAPDAGSYYGRPVLREPVWTWEIPWYFFAGGLSGASSALALGARLSGSERLARRLHLVAFAGVAASPLLLISDLGRPERFLNMLRVFKVTSPMSVGSWILAADGAASTLALAPIRGVREAGEVAAAALGLPLATYTGALVADTSIPVWHEARRELPLLFAAGSAASAGAAGALVGPGAEAGPARRLAVLGGIAELGSTLVMERRLGFLGEPYHQGEAGRYGRLAKACTAAGSALMALAGRRRAGAAAAAALLLAGSALQRWSVFKAGFQSARDPRYTVEPQRERAGSRRGGSAPERRDSTPRSGARRPATTTP